MSSFPSSPLGSRFNPFSAAVQALLDRAVYATLRFESIEPLLAAVIRRISDEGELELPFIDTILGGGNEFAANRWDYPWIEAEETAARIWQPKPNGRTSATLGPARNLAEYLNDLNMADHGVTLNDPPVTFTVKKIPAGQPIKVWASNTPAGVSYWLYAVNALDPTCNSGLAVQQGRTPRFPIGEA